MIAARLLGVACLALVAGVGVRDLAHVVEHWSEMGPLAAGTVAPGFEVESVDGGTFSSRDLEGRVSVLTFWATWCGACSAEMPILQQLHDEHTESDVQVVAVNREGSGVSGRQARALATRYRRAKRLSMPFVIDPGQMGRAFRVSAIPHTVVVDRRGAIRHVHQGRVGKDTLSDEIAELLAE